MAKGTARLPGATALAMRIFGQSTATRAAPDPRACGPVYAFALEDLPYGDCRLVPESLPASALLNRTWRFFG